MRLLAAIGVVCAALATAGAVDPGPPVRRLTVVESKTPHIHWACSTAALKISGRIPQFFDRGVPLRRVNAVLRAAILADERFVSTGCPARKYVLPGGRLLGYYQPMPRLGLMSASSVVVSALMPAAKTPPQANFSYDWEAVTIDVATSRQVQIGDLFRDPREGLELLGTAARPRVAATDPCLGNNPLPRAFAPEAANFRYFALTPKGLALAFTAGTIGPPSCGYRQITLPYSLIRPALGELGRKLVAGVRRPLA